MNEANETLDEVTDRLMDTDDPPSLKESVQGIRRNLLIVSSDLKVIGEHLHDPKHDANVAEAISRILNSDMCTMIEELKETIERSADGIEKAILRLCDVMDR